MEEYEMNLCVIVEFLNNYLKVNKVYYLGFELY